MQKQVEVANVFVYIVAYTVIGHLPPMHAVSQMCYAIDSAIFQFIKSFIYDWPNGIKLHV